MQRAIGVGLILFGATIASCNGGESDPSDGPSAVNDPTTAASAGGSSNSRGLPAQGGESSSGNEVAPSGGDGGRLATGGTVGDGGESGDGGGTGGMAGTGGATGTGSATGIGGTTGTVLEGIGTCSKLLNETTPVCCEPRGENRDLADEMFKLLNDHRASQGLAKLKRDAALEAAMQGHVMNMTIEGFFNHSNTLPGQESLEKYGRRAQQCGAGASGENLTVTMGPDAAKTAMDTWTGSPGHNANMLRNWYTRVGIGVHAKVEDGRRKLYWGQLFGS